MDKTLWEFDRAAGAAGAEFRLGHLWRRRLDARAHPCDGQAHPGGNPADAGRASHLRRRDARGNRCHRAQLSRRRRAPYRGAARRSDRRRGHANTRRIRAAIRMPPTWWAASSASRRFRSLGVGLSGEASRFSPTVSADIDMLKAKVDAGAEPRHHAVLLRERSLFPLSRPRARARHRYPDRAGHPAGAELQVGDEFRRARRRLGAGLAGRAFPRARPRCRPRAS